MLLYSILYNTSQFSGKYMPYIIAFVAITAAIFANECSFISMNCINYCLMLVMFGMGQTLKMADLKAVFTRPKCIMIGCIAQFLTMPLIAFTLGKMFNLDTALFVGVVLVGTCPGGTASNLMTFLAKGDIALSIGMTTLNTLLAPIITPLLTYLLLHSVIEIDIKQMIISIVMIVIIPISAGLVINKFFSKKIEKITFILPLTSIIAISLIIAAVISHNIEQIKDASIVIVTVCLLHNILGFLSGFLVAKYFKMSTAKIKAMTIEIGMQNAGLATSLAQSSFPTLPLATVPGAIFSVIHNITGSILANYVNKKENIIIANPESSKM